MSAPADSEPLFALVGNPNCGKTTVFNALTGLRQKVANYPGVTVEKKIGECYSQHGEKLRVIDLPGAYSLNARSPDEAVLRDVLLGRREDTPKPDRVILIVDASNLERNLYLTTQVLELGLPTIIALNMVDVAEAKLWRIDIAKLSEVLGVPVVPLQANAGKGLIELKIAMSQAKPRASTWNPPAMPDDVRAELEMSRGVLCSSGAIRTGASLLEPLYLINDHDPSHYAIEPKHAAAIHECRRRISAAFPGWEDTLVESRYAAIDELTKATLRRPETETQTVTDRIDNWLLHPWFGGLSVVLVLGLLFYLIFSIASVPQGWIEAGFEFLGDSVQDHMGEGDLRNLIVKGVLPGMSGVLIFLPQIMILFFFIGLMEDTGYMARIAFIVDRMMSFVGLNGKAFLPFLSSYACAVPGIMATRTIDNPKDRLITILIAPLASCSARLPVYGLLIPAMMPTSAFVKAMLMLSMYLLGTFGAFFFAWLFNKGVMRGVPSPMILEMPAYKRPALQSVLMHVWERAMLFVKRAGTVILGLSIIIWAASTYPKTPGADKSTQLANSIAGQAGHLIAPVIKPLGYDWKIGIGLITSFAAREVFVTTMSTVYAVQSGDDDDTQPLRERLAEERWPDGRPIYTPLVCLSLLVFYVFAMQCMSTLAVVRRETGGWKWPAFMLGYMTGTAYLLALAVYQIGKMFMA